MTARDMTLQLHKSVDNLQIHLTAQCEWYIRIEKDRRIREFQEKTIEEALQKALDYKWLPLVPKKPERYVYTIQKGSYGQYHIMYNGYWVARYKKKSEAEEGLNQLNARQEKDIEEWNRQYAWTLTKQVGVDFEYIR